MVVFVIVDVIFLSRGNTLILLYEGYLCNVVVVVVVIYMVVLVSAIYGRSTSQANKEQTEIATWGKISIKRKNVRQEDHEWGKNALWEAMTLLHVHVLPRW